ncbi:MAG: ABC transporter ATP-binding protein, partial [Bacteroidota bacterium]
SFWYQKLIAPRYAEMRSKVGGLMSRLENNLGGIMVIKSFSAEDYEKQRVAEASEAYRTSNVSVIRLNARYVPLIRMVVALGFAGCMLLGSWWVLNGSGGITPGGLTFFGMMIQRLLWPMTRMGNIFDDFARAQASIKRVFSLLRSTNRLKGQSLPAAEGLPARFTGTLSLMDVNFRYTPDQQTLQGLNLKIPAGQTWGIAGPSGSGKTTLIKLLLRLYDPSSGKISLDDVDLRAIPLPELRRQIAIVSQDTYLFHGTIGENIAYGQPEATEDTIEGAAREAQLHAFIASLPDGYNTLVGERGIKLSGGQRQRVSIARAILKDAPILILDEATSAVDSETERAIQENLDRLVHGRTALIIAHRLSTIRGADQILVLADGKIAEIGTHDDLIEANGAYAALWEVQTGMAHA